MNGDLYFSQIFKSDPEVLESYGALDVSLLSDLPLFIDPFLLFHSDKTNYQQLHEDIIKYLTFLRDKASTGLNPGLIRNLYRFQEVKQNWLGFTYLGNSGHGLGDDFAKALHEALSSILATFGSETITHGPHLEKLTLIKEGVGRDNISDFTTNLIKGFLLEYTQTFAREHLADEYCDNFSVTRAVFNYATEAWATKTYYLPKFNGDFVLLTPTDILTRDDTWISRSDMLGKFDRLPESISDDQLRAQINNYFGSRLGDRPSKKERDAAAAATIREFPDLVDRYIRIQEDDGDKAVSASNDKRVETQALLVHMVKQVVADSGMARVLSQGGLNSYQDAVQRVLGFKQYVENQDGWKLINKPGQLKPFSRESDVQLFFGLIFFGTAFDINREPNNGRGPVDFKVSMGAADKTLIEFKLASNSQLKRNLQKQIEIYEKANGTRTSVKVIICYTEQDQVRVAAILDELKLSNEESVVVIDARSDNKQSGSKA
ncbi:MAG: hypothetical protein PHN51_04485 [Candidatus Nanopelagicales bacterium]|nr:hypothetical protein [Candidatus Nanopelagicales bacterium]